MKPLTNFRGLYAIVDDTTHHEFGLPLLLEYLVMDSLVPVIQLRLKKSSHAEKLKIIAVAKHLKTKRSFDLIINDDVEFLDHLAIDGVHLGFDDADVKIIRQKFPRSILGVSTHNLAEAQLAVELGANYLGCGCLFPTATKTNTQILTFAELQKITTAIHIPKIGIGGIRADNMLQVLQAGCEMVAMISGLTEQNQFVGHTLHNTLIRTV